MDFIKSILNEYYIYGCIGILLLGIILGFTKTITVYRDFADLTKVFMLVHAPIGLFYILGDKLDFFEPPFCNEGTLEWIAYEDLLSIPTPKTDWYIYKYILDSKPFAFSAEYDEQLNLLSMTEEIENLKII